MTRKIRVGLLFGGRSGEHEVSLASASSVLAALDPEKYEPVGIGITRRGEWLMSSTPDRLLAREVTAETSDAVEVAPDFARHTIVPVNGHRDPDGAHPGVDVVFPLLHGPYGEDGTVQGFLELAGIPYVGSGVLGSAVSMDKVVMKNLFEQAGLAQVPYTLVRGHDWRRDSHGIVADLEGHLSYPVFVKPCNLGSSVGISKAHDRQELRDALDHAARFDGRLIVEQGVDAREVECSVMGNEEPMASVPGEIVSHHEFYDYESKYTDGLADLIIPARLSREATNVVRELAVRAFEAVDAAGLARVDFFVRRSDGEILVNEINTMPGFTATSMYPKLWEASGVPYSELIDRLIAYALRRHQQRQERSAER